ncbi:hypothetical protein NBH00_19345 [Paraconexibacter antarcticus]|uniref:beta-N-acetylhexosaminidase n=1 Tax=Paraconexibacter antarcticus TaxID=2949664 RepID=A0ABY5DP99_9ACTN|nr:glycoside hydrolase family 3 N-terminal domain-containing protein [Paraconexibacter antarcticus]UTI63491.1 hypothetical protein NBH00_19345 [Paraconexibacter antarcticus]
MVPIVRRRVAALVLLLLLAGGGVAGVLALTHDSSPKVPEGGSAFGGDDRRPAHESLIDALAPLLAAGTAAPTVPASASAVATPAATTTAPRARRPARPAGQAQRLAQLFMVGFRGRGTADPFLGRLALRRWGVVILDGANYASRTQFAALTAQLKATLAGLGAPVPLLAVEQGGGADNTIPNLPPAGQAAIHSRARASAQARRASGILRGLGVRLALTANADIGYSGGAWDGRAFSDDPKIVRQRAAAAIRGWRRGGVAPAIGHYPGEGAASQDPANGPATVGLGLAELRASDLRALDPLLPSVPALVISNALYAAYDGVTPATLLPAVPALARKAGFRGTIISGNLAETVLASGGSIASAAVDALKAGCDLLWIPGDAGDQEAAYRAVVQAVRTGEIPQRRVRSALAHVAALKARYAKG